MAQRPARGGWRTFLPFLAAALLLQCIVAHGALLPEVYVSNFGADSASCGPNGQGCKTLAYALTRVAAGGTILLRPGTYTQAGALSIVGKSVSVQAVDPSATTVVDCAQGACFEASCTSGPGVDCSAISLVLNGFTVTNGNTTRGGCLSVKGQSATLTGMTVTGCTATVNGGAVAVSGANLTLVSSTISDSSATTGDGGCIYASQQSIVVANDTQIANCNALASVGGGVVAQNSNLTMTDSSIELSAARLLGGGLYSYKAGLHLTNTTFSGNSAATGGGMADQESVVVVVLGVFLNNTATPLPAFLADPTYGGGMHMNYSVSVLVSDTQFINCTSLLDGGGFKAASVPSVTLSKNNVTGCGASGNGGGVVLDTCTAFVEGCHFVENILQSIFGFGGGLYATTSNLTMSDSLYLSNGLSDLSLASYQQGGAFAYFEYSQDSFAYESLLVTGTTFDSNWCNQGGAIYIEQENLNQNAGSELTLKGLSLEFTDCVFKNNYAVSLGGAGEFLAGVTFDSCTFTNNTAQMGGGALSIEIKDQRFRVLDSLCENNQVLQGDGGCVYIPQGFSNVFISGLTFNNNSAPEGRGGGLFQQGVALAVKNSSFTGNTAALQGGGLAVVGVTLSGNVVVGNFTDCNFTSNSAPLGGGGLYVANFGVANVTRALFLENNSTLGGAINLGEYAQLNLTESTCQMNNASEGGGCISLQDFAQATLSDTTISTNAATSEGGAVFCTGSSQLVLDTCTVSVNTAQTGAGIYLESSSTLSASQTAFVDNTALFQGGGVYQINVARTEVANAIFTGNNAPEGAAMFVHGTSTATLTASHVTASIGGALSFQGSSVGRLNECELRDNTAALGANGGGVLASDTSLVVVTATNLTSNKAQIGGGLYAAGQATVQVLLSKFTNNTAQEGGAFVGDGTSVLTVRESTFVTNVAATDGAGVALLSSCTGTVAGCNFTQNEAGGDGAGVYLARSPLAGSGMVLGLLTIANLTFDANLAPASSGAAYFDASFEPANRVTCLSCLQLTALDTISSLPTHFRFVWPGQNDTGVGSFAVVASSGDPVSVLQIMVLDEYGHLIQDENEAVAEVQPTPRISGLLTGTAKQGLISIPNIQVSVPNGDISPLQLQVYLSSPTQLFPTIERNLTVDFCPAGQYYSSTLFKCQICPLGQWCAAGALSQACPDNSFSFQPGAASLSDCSQCGGGLKCQQGNSTVLEGFWVDPYSIVHERRPAVYGCDQTIGCAGYQYEGEVQQQCLDGYEGRVCSACSGGYYGFLDTCSKCSSSYKAAFWVVAVVVVALWIVLNWLTSEFTGADTILVEMQLLAVVGAFNLDYFTGTWISSLFQIFNLTLFFPDFLGPECISTGYSFASRWVFTAVLPWAGIAFYLAKFLLEDLRNSAADRGGPRFEWMRCHKAPTVRRDELIKRVLNLLDLLYISMTIRCFQVYHWQQYDHKVLSVDPSILWLSTTHVEILPFAVIYTGLYIIGLPLFFAWVLSTGKMRAALHEDKYLDRYSQLYERYQRQYWWWYLPMTCGRRLAYAAVLVFFSAHPDMQAYLTFLLVLVLSLVHYFVRPHKATALDVLVGVLLLGQYLYLLGGTANSYMTSYVAGTPSEAIAGTALLLFLLAIAVVMVLELQEVWARFWVRQWADANEDKTAKRSYPKVPLIKFSDLIGRSRSSSSQAELMPGGSAGDAGEDSLVQLSSITDWFNPHVLAAFLRTASVSDLNLLQMIRVTYSYRIPSEEEVRQAALILDCLPAVMRFSFINELLAEVEGDITSGLLSGSGSPPSLALSKVEGLQKSKDLKVLADAAAGDKRRAGETLSLFLNPRAVEKMVAWLLYDTGLEGRRALADLVQKFNVWLLVLPREPSWFDWTKKNEKTELQPFELNLRRKMRRFYLRLAL